MLFIKVLCPTNLGKKGKETLFIHGNNFKVVSLWGHVGEMLVFGERGKPEYPEKNLSEQDETLDQRIKPGPHWWEASALGVGG